MLWRRILWPYLALFAEVLAFFRHVLFSGHHLIPWDLQYYHQPLAWFASRSLGRGELPLWDPFTYCGMPIYANLTTQLFYPPTFAIYLASNWMGEGRHLLYLLEWQIVLHVWLGGVFAYRLLRRLEVDMVAAVIGATVYQSGAYFASQTQHLGAMDVAAWLPLAWWAVIELRERLRVRWVAILAAALALSFLAGFPAATAVVYGTTALLALGLILAGQARWMALAGCGAAAVWSVLLIAVQLLPTMELSALSVASLRADFMGSGGGIPLAALWTLISPNHFGAFTFDPGQWKLPWNPTFLYLYCGLPALLFAAWAVIRRRDRWTVTMTALTLTGALWMLGDSTPVYRLAFAVLPDRLKASLYSEFALCAFTLALALLAGLGAQTWLVGRRPAVGWAAAVITALDLIAVSSGRPINTIDARREPGMSYWHYDRFPEIPARMRQLVNQATPPYRTDTMQGSLNWSSGAPLFEVPTANGDDPFALIRYMQVRTSFTGGERWGRYYEVRDPDSPLLKFLNVRYVLANGAITTPGRLSKHTDLPGTMVYENPGPLPRFFLVDRVRSASGMEEAVAALRAPGFDPAREAVVEGSAKPLQSAGSVRVRRYAPRLVELETEAMGPSLLVSSEAWYPGWRAYVDGREAQLVLTNAAFRGLFLPKGRHTVRMEFQPDILYRGGAVSGLALLLLIAALVVRDNGPKRGPWISSSS
jgi:hypothetical protein